MAAPSSSKAPEKITFTETQLPELDGKKVTFFYPLPMPRLHCPFPNCHKSFQTIKDAKRNESNLWRLTRHLKTDHNISQLTELHQCLVCKKEIVDKFKMRHFCLKEREVPTNTVENPHSCENCRKSFFSLKSLKTHMRIHRTKSQPVNFKSLPKKSKIETSETPTITIGDATVSIPDFAEDDEEQVEVNNFDMDQPEMEVDCVPDEISNAVPVGDLPARVRQWKVDLFKYLKLLERTPKIFAMFETKMAEIISRIQLELKINTDWHERQQYKDEEDLNDYALRKLYARNPKRAVNLLKGTKPLVCNIEPGDILEHFGGKMADSEPIDENYFENIPAHEEQDEAKFRVIRAEEVVAKLKKFRNTAAGPDKLKYKHWETVDPTGELLCIIYNICLKFHRVPAAWKRSKTFLFSKNDNPTSIDDWRPISLLCTIYKLYSALLSVRLREWCSKFGIIDKSQKGGTESDVVLEHGFVLDYLIRSAKEQNTQLSLAFLDIKEAFPSTPVSAVLMALGKSGAGDRICKIIKDILYKRTTEIITGQGTTSAISIERGLLLGDPISNILFTLVLNYTIMKVNMTGGGSVDKYIPYSVLADVDDIAVFSKSEEDLQQKVTIIDENLKLIHMDLSPKKCVALHVDGKSKTTLDIEIYVNQIRIRHLEYYEYHVYIGIEIGYQRPVPPTPMDLFEGDAERILSSGLGGWQKIDAVRTFLMPAWHHQLKMGWNRRKDWEEFDKYLVQRLRYALGLPQNAPKGYIYGARRYACLGMTTCRDDYDILKIVSAFKLLTSTDPVVSEVASLDLQHHIRPTSTKEEQIRNEMMEFLSSSSKIEVSLNESIWSQAKVSSKSKTITWNCDGNGFVSLDYLGFAMEIKDSKRIMRDLRNEVKTSYSKNLMDPNEYPWMGKSISMFTGYSNQIFASCKSSQDWDFIHPARLNISPVKASQANRVMKRDTSCRKCRSKDPRKQETLTHVLDCCEVTKHYMTDRHNAVIELLIKALKKDYRIVTVDQCLPKSTSSKRPDLLVTKGLQAYIIDVACPMDMEEKSLKDSAAEKVRKYEPLRLEYERNHHKTRAEIVPFIVGARGAWYPPNEQFLKKVIENKHDRQELTKKCIATVIRWSRCIYAAHVRNWEIKVENGYPSTFPSTIEPELPHMSQLTLNDSAPMPSTSASSQDAETNSRAQDPTSISTISGESTLKRKAKAISKKKKPVENTPQESKGTSQQKGSKSTSCSNPTISVAPQPAAGSSTNSTPQKAKSFSNTKPTLCVATRPIAGSSSTPTPSGSSSKGKPKPRSSSSISTASAAEQKPKRTSPRHNKGKRSHPQDYMGGPQQE